MNAVARTVWMDLKQAFRILLFVPFVLFSGVAPATMLQDTGDGLEWVLCQDDRAISAVFNADGDLEPGQEHAHDPCTWSQVGAHQVVVAPKDFAIADMRVRSVQYGTGQSAIFQPENLKRPIARGPPAAVI